MSLAKRYYKKYWPGGSVNSPESMQMAGGIGQGAGIASTMIDAFSPADKYGKRSGFANVGGGALKGAAAGAQFGPIGVGVGAAVGLAAGFLTNGKQKEEANRLKGIERINNMQSEQKMATARISGDPASVYGNLSSGYYAAGGHLKMFPDGGKITNQHRTDWNNYVAWLDAHKLKGDPRLDKDNYGFKVLEDYRKENPNTTITKDMIVPIQQEFSNYRNWSLEQIRQKKAAMAPGTTEENYMKNLSVVDGIPGQRTTSFQFPQAYLTTFNNNQSEGTVNQGFVKMKAAGGSLADGYKNMANEKVQGGTATALNSSAAEFNGPSHEGGGIQLPGMNAEVEGNETTNGDYVFSDRLGFAALHKPIAKAIGKIEKKALSPERVVSIKLLKEKENQLKLSQEYVKHTMGLN